MTNVIVKIVNADYYDTVQIFVDGVPYGKKKGNATFEIPVTQGEHVIHGIYDNMEPDFAGISHALGPVKFTAAGAVINFTVRISNISSGGKLLKD